MTGKTDRRLDRSEHVLDKEYTTSLGVVFGPGGEDGPFGLPVVTIDKQDWADFGEPERISIVLRPGDHLNNREGASDEQ